MIEDGVILIVAMSHIIVLVLHLCFSTPSQYCMFSLNWVARMLIMDGCDFQPFLLRVVFSCVMPYTGCLHFAYRCVGSDTLHTIGTNVLDGS